MKKVRKELKTKPLSILLILALALALAGCGGKKEEESPEVNVVGDETPEANEEQQPETEAEDTPETSEPEAGETSEADGFYFAQLENWSFSFSSGAGAWSTELKIHGDGSFDGMYTDADMGSTGDGYPNGTLYLCSFSGQLAPLEKVDDYTYSTRIQDIQYENEAGTQEIVDDTLYIYSDAYGLEDAEEILIYLPGMPVDRLSEEFLSWMQLYNQKTELPFYALNNTVHQEGFTSYNVAENERSYIDLIEKETEKLEKSLAEDNPDQATMDEISQDIFTYWDSALNSVWNDLKQIKDEAFMADLLEEEREWIAWKEKEVEAAGADAGGETTELFAANRKAAELTKERVYELLELFD